jgi:2-methylcitrate dehydratase
VPAPPSPVPVDPLSALAALVVGAAPARAATPADRAARVLLLDSLACAVAARDHPAVAKATVAATALFGGDSATGLGSSGRYGVAGAVLDSGAAIRALDFNDFYWGAGIGGHPSDLYALTLAVAESTRSNLGQLLHATAIGYEVYLRLLDLMRSDGPFDHTTAMTLAGAAATGRLLALDTTSMTQALAIAVVRGPALSALRQGAISEAKAVAPALAAINGLMAAQLAAAGIGGPVAAACGPLGLQTIVAAGADLGRLAEPCGFGSKLVQVSVKRYPCIGTAQAAVAVACALHRQAAAARSAIERIEFQLADHHLVRHQTTAAYRRPEQRETADHSFYSLLAMAMADGDVTPAQFAVGRWRDPDIHALSDRIEFSFGLAGGTDGVFAARAQAVLADGGRIAAAVDHPPGHPAAPLDDAAITAKFHACVRGRLAQGRAHEVVESCLHGSGQAPVGHLVQLLRTGNTPHA